ncbi:MAG: iron-sulfur cluster assembly scaffold protein [Gammaproteobacteria bacterium]|nr:iron-sulfur cluster assembly scaffold protein [Gammaproteobacteria bacterium]
MSGDPYSAAVRELFAAPTHAGTVADGTRVLVEDQGMRVEIAASVAQGQLSAVRFRAWGCPHLIAAAEWACRHYENGPASALDKFPTDRIMEDLAVPTEKTGRILVLEDAIRSLGRSLTSKQT